MRLSVFGLGYVGSVTAACMPGLGHHVIGVDINVLNVDALMPGAVLSSRRVWTNWLPRPTKLACSGLLSKQMQRSAIRNSLSFVLRRPVYAMAKLDLTHLRQVCREIGEPLRHKPTSHTIVVRSAVLPRNSGLCCDSHLGGSEL